MESPITIDVVTDIKEAQEIWNAYHTGTSLYDSWKYRSLYFQFFSYPLQFYIVSINNEVIAVLPMQWNTDQQHLEFFGGDYMSDNTIYLKRGNEKYLKELSKQMARPLRLFWTAKPYILSSWKTCMISYKYVLPLQGLNTIDDFLQLYWSKKSRKNIQHQMEELQKLNVQVQEDNYNDLDLLIELNKKRFGKASSFYKPFRKEFLQEVIKHFDVKMLSVTVQGKKESVCYSVFYNNVYYGINSGRNTAINNLGKFVMLEKISRAITSGAVSYDAGRADLGWKRAFHFKPVPLYSVSTI